MSNRWDPRLSSCLLSIMDPFSELKSILQGHLILEVHVLDPLPHSIHFVDDCSLFQVVDKGVGNEDLDCIVVEGNGGPIGNRKVFGGRYVVVGRFFGKFDIGRFEVSSGKIGRVSVTQNSLFTRDPGTAIVTTLVVTTPVSIAGIALIVTFFFMVIVGARNNRLPVLGIVSRLGCRSEPKRRGRPRNLGSRPTRFFSKISRFGNDGLEVLTKGVRRECISLHILVVVLAYGAGFVLMGNNRVESLQKLVYIRWALFQTLAELVVNSAK